jgi:hypothetical protein
MENKTISPSETATRLGKAGCPTSESSVLVFARLRHTAHGPMAHSVMARTTPDRGATNGGHL